MDGIRKRACWARRAELALLQGRPPLALDIAERLIASAPGMSAGQVIPYLWQLKAEALTGMGQTEEAGLLLRAAVRAARMAEWRFLLWRLHASLGHLYGTLGRQNAAEGERSTAHGLVEELADTLPHGDLRDNYLQRAHERIATSPKE